MKKKQVISTLLATIMAVGMLPSPSVYAESAADSAPKTECTQADPFTPTTDGILADIPGDGAVRTDGKELQKSSETGEAAAQVELNTKIEMSAGSQIKIWERLNGGNADPQNVGEYFEGQPVAYDGWQLMKLTVTVPAQEGLEVTQITPRTEGLYPEKSTLVKESDGWKYTYYFKRNGTYGFNISYTFNGALGEESVEYTVSDLVYIPDVTLLGFFIVAMDTNEVHGYITKTDLIEGRDYNQDGTYETGRFLGPGTGGPGYFFPYVKNLEGMQYVQTMRQLELYPGSWYGGKNPFDAESLEPLTRGYYPELTKFYFTAPYSNETTIKPEAYTAEMLGRILTRMPNLCDFSANKTGFKDFKVFAQMNGKLESIDCSYNQITSLEGVEGHTGLTHLSLNQNNISDLTPLSNIPTAYQWNFIQNNISDLTPIANVKVNKVIHFGFQTVLPEPVFAELNGDTYKLVLPMPVDIDGTSTKIGFANWLAPQIGNLVPEEQRTKLRVKFSDTDDRLYPIAEANGEFYVEIPKTDVPNGGTPQAFNGTVMRFWFHNDNGTDSRTRGNFNGKVDFTATAVQEPVTHGVKYEFAADGKQLPVEVMQQLPVEHTVNEGETVMIPADLVLQDVKTQDGIWSFVGWDKTEAENVTAPVVFTGTWKFSRFAGTVNEAPIINVSDRTLTQGDTFDPKENVTASDAEDDLTDQIVVVNGAVDTTTPGVYEVIYKVTDKDGASTTKTIRVTVNPKLEGLNAVPTITAADKQLTVGDEFDARKDVTAADREDGDLTDEIVVVNGAVDTTTPGVYEVIYRVTDKDGASTTKTIQVTVMDKEIIPEPEKPVDPPTAVPQTGDNSYLVLWSLLSLFSLIGVISTFLIGNKRRKYSN